MILAALHVFLAALAAFRLTTLFNQEEIWEPIRRRFPAVPWGCMLCMSVWGGAIGTLFFLTVPWLNWPLAFSWLYLSYKSSQERKRMDVQPSAQPPQPPPQENDFVTLANVCIEILAQQRNAALDQVVYWQSEAEKFRRMVPVAAKPADEPKP